MKPLAASKCTHHTIEELTGLVKCIASFSDEFGGTLRTQKLFAAICTTNVGEIVGTRQKEADFKN
jgi:hypothetical protein